MLHTGNIGLYPLHASTHETVWMSVILPFFFFLHTCLQCGSAIFIISHVASMPSAMTSPQRGLLATVVKSNHFSLQMAHRALQRHTECDSVVDSAYNNLCQTSPAVQYLQHTVCCTQLPVISMFHTKAKACMCTNFVCRHRNKSNRNCLTYFEISDASCAFFTHM